MRAPLLLSLVSSFVGASLVSGLALWAPGCGSDDPSPAPVTTSDAGDAAAPEDTAPVDTGADVKADVPPPDPFLGCTKDPGPGAVTVPETETGTDPIGGAEKFTMEMALQGFPSAATGKLTAAITTQLGIIVCTLDETAAPITVANFVGLARGTRPFYDTSVAKWVARRFYDGLKWHRVIPDFVIQGGDPRGTGSGGPGYDLVKENWIKEPAGTLAMAAGDAPSGSQFYIVVGTGPAPNYNVFGTCTLDVAEKISYVETNSSDRPRVPIHMQRIDIARCP